MQWRAVYHNKYFPVQRAHIEIRVIYPYDNREYEQLESRPSAAARCLQRQVQKLR